MKRATWFIAGFLIACFALGAPAASALSLPAPAVRFYALTPTPISVSDTPTPDQPTPYPTMQPVSNPITAIGELGWQGQVQCWNCAPFTAMVHLSHYDPMSGPDNCWDYDETMRYCYSPTKPGLHWKGFWGIGAACPPEWPYGTWVVIPSAGAYICIDRGGAITCDPDTNVCNVDILGPGGAPWDGGTYQATLWVPLDPPRQ